MTTNATAPENGDSPDDGHFAFGENWSRFLATVDEDRILAAENSLRKLLGTDDLRQRSFLDAGSGSGLFSLAATRLGASVTSFDLDPQSVACARELKNRYADTADWNIRSGSLTDHEFLETLGTFDVVYCWGVAHHTGRMWSCIEHLLPRISPQGKIVLAIYNDQQYLSRGWSGIKSAYQRLPKVFAPGTGGNDRRVGVCKTILHNGDGFVAAAGYTPQSICSRNQLDHGIAATRDAPMA